MSRRPCRQCGQPNEEEVGADQFKKKTNFLRSISVVDREGYVTNDTPHWIGEMFANLKSG